MSTIPLVHSYEPKPYESQVQTPSVGMLSEVNIYFN